MRSVEVAIDINAPREVVLREISEYTHPPILHSWCIKSVNVLEDKDDVSIALWKLKVLGFTREAKQKQIITPPDKMTNETIGGFARGTLESTFLYETDGGTRIVDRIDVRVPGLFKPLEWPVAWYTRRITWRILMDHKKDLESRYGSPGGEGDSHKGEEE
ncbi:MAG: SRPBCC family protein [Dehalococcoidia bacterium]|nr:MAG: SRPBCC family protein [Dehalococcoidia bacterium]